MKVNWNELTYSQRIALTQDQRWNTLKFRFALWCLNVLFWKVPHHVLYPEYRNFWDRLNDWAADVYDWGWCEGKYQLPE